MCAYMQSNFQEQVVQLLTDDFNQQYQHFKIITGQVLLIRATIHTFFIAFLSILLSFIIIYDVSYHIHW